MSTAALVTVAEYLRRTGKPNCEYMDGVLYPKAMPTKLHALIQYRLVAMLRALGLDALAEVTVRLSPDKFLVPDVVAAVSLENPYPTGPVALCIEILSPEDRVGAMLAKCEQYHAWGVPFCWVIDPIKQIVWQYDGGGEPVRLDRASVLRAGELMVSLSELFKDLPANQA